MVIVKGAIGLTDRQNRDDKRVFDRGGYSPTLKSHIAKEQIRVLKKYETKNDRHDPDRQGI